MKIKFASFLLCAFVFITCGSNNTSDESIIDFIDGSKTQAQFTQSTN